MIMGPPAEKGPLAGLPGVVPVTATSLTGNPDRTSNKLILSKEERQQAALLRQLTASAPEAAEAILRNYAAPESARELPSSPRPVIEVRSEADEWYSRNKKTTVSRMAKKGRRYPLVIYTHMLNRWWPATLTLSLATTSTGTMPETSEPSDGDVISAEGG